MNEQEKAQLQELLDFKKQLESSHSIPLKIDQAFRERFKNSVIKTTTKGADTEDVTVVSSVNFVAQTVGTTVVLNDPDNFLEVNIDGTIYYLAAWTA